MYEPNANEEKIPQNLRTNVFPTVNTLDSAKIGGKDFHLTTGSIATLFDSFTIEYPISTTVVWNRQTTHKMKTSIAVLSLCAFLATHSSHAWAPRSAGFASRPTTRSVFPSSGNFHQVQQNRITTSIYATVEDEEKKGASAPTNDAAFISDAFNKDDAEEALTFFSPIPYSELTIGIVKETFKGENRVSQTPDSVKGLVKAGFTVVVESGGMYGERDF